MSSLVERIVTLQFPNDKPLSIKRLARGIENENYRVIYQYGDTPNNHQIVVTVFPREGQKKKVRKELLIRQIIAGRLVPIPSLVASSSEFSTDGIPPYVIREYAEGLDLDEVLEAQGNTFTEENRRRAAIKMGDILGSMHEISLPAFGRLEEVVSESTDKIAQKYTFSSWEDFFSHLFNEQLAFVDQLDDSIVIGRSSVKDLKDLTPQIIKFFYDNKPLLSSVSHPRFCHNDTRFGNFIIDDKRDINAIIDFEWAIAGDPDLDLVYIENWLHFAPYRKTVRFLIPEFLVGYEPHRKIPPEYPQKRPLYHLYRSLSYLNAVFSKNPDEFLRTSPRSQIYVSAHMCLLRNIVAGKFNIPCAYTRWELNNGVNPEAEISIDPVNRLLAKHLAYGEKYAVQIGGVNLIIHPDVFNPALTNTSVFLAENVVIPVGARVLDMFSGSGYQAIKAAQGGASEVVAIDHSPKAVACIRENVEKNNVTHNVTVMQGDLFAPLAEGERFDVIIANPPLLPGVPRTLLETAVYDPGLETIRRFLNQLSDHLNPKGEVFLLFSDAGEKIGLGGFSFIEEICRHNKNKLEAKVIATKPVGYETYLVIRITHNQD